MPNKNNRQRIIEQLKLNENMEMMRHEIEEMLNKELAKPAEEIDAQLVQDLLDLLEVPAPTQEQRDTAWNAIEQSTRKPRKPNWSKVLLRCAAAAAAVIVLFFVTVQTAEAFKWTFLLKLLSPVAETFGIYSASNPDHDLQDEPAASYTDAETEYQQVNYSSIDEMPTELHGVRIVPTWMMDGYEFVQGSVYEDPGVIHTFVAYVCDDKSAFLTTQIFLKEENVSSYEFEQSIQKYGSEQIAGQQVAMYRNAQGDIEAYSWITAGTHYVFTGQVTLAELEKIIEGLVA